MHAADTRSAGDLIRAGLAEVPRWLGVVVLMTHRHVLRLELAPGSSPNHLLGWEILTAEHDNITLRATGPLLGALLVARRVPPSTAVLETFVSYRRPVAGAHHLDCRRAHPSCGRVISTAAGGYVACLTAHP